jgi:uncharacterized protein (UPF0276 family)
LPLFYFQRASHPLRLVPYLDGLNFAYASVHTLELSVVSPEPPSLTYLDALVAIAKENGAVAITDHLGFNQGEPGGANVGHVTAPAWTPSALDATCRNVDFIQRHFGKFPFFLENLAHFFVFRGTMSEADFFRRVLEKTGCGLLLDVTNAYANAMKQAVDVAGRPELLRSARGPLWAHVLRRADRPARHRLRRPTA